jgi:hypothetical protein
VSSGARVLFPSATGLPYIDDVKCKGTSENNPGIHYTERTTSREPIDYTRARQLSCTQRDTKRPVSDSSAGSECVLAQTERPHV